MGDQTDSYDTWKGHKDAGPHVKAVKSALKKSGYKHLGVSDVTDRTSPHSQGNSGFSRVRVHVGPGDFMSKHRAPISSALGKAGLKVSWQGYHSNPKLKTRFVEYNVHNSSLKEETMAPEKVTHPEHGEGTILETRGEEVDVLFGDSIKTVPLNELSKRTLANYIAGASTDKSGHAHEIGYQNAQGVESGRPRDSNFHTAQRKHGRRSLGIQVAAGKLSGNKYIKRVATEEVEQIDELGAGTLASYSVQAAHDLRIRSFDHGANLAKNFKRDPKATDDSRRKTKNRAVGLGRAAVKLQKKTYKEDAPITEGQGDPIVHVYHDKIDQKSPVGMCHLSTAASIHGFDRFVAADQLAKDKEAKHGHIRLKLAEEVEQINEAGRGRPKLPRDQHGNIIRDPKALEAHKAAGTVQHHDDSGEDAGDSHIVSQLHKASSIGKHVVFKNGDKVHVPAMVARRAIFKHNSLPPKDRVTFASHIGSSHQAFHQAIHEMAVEHYRPIVSGRPKIEESKSISQDEFAKNNPRKAGDVAYAAKHDHGGSPQWEGHVTLHKPYTVGKSNQGWYAKRHSDGETVIVHHSDLHNAR